MRGGGGAQNSKHLENPKKKIAIFTWICKLPFILAEMRSNSGKTEKEQYLQSEEDIYRMVKESAHRRISVHGIRVQISGSSQRRGENTQQEQILMSGALKEGVETLNKSRCLEALKDGVETLNKSKT